MADASSKLSVEQAKALEVILAGGSVDEAAEASEVHERTVYRWLNSASFQEALNEIKAGIVARAKMRGAALLDGAVDACQDCVQPVYPHVLKKRQRGTLNPQMVRLAAAREIFERFGLGKASLTAEEATAPAQVFVLSTKPQQAPQTTDQLMTELRKRLASGDKPPG